LGAFCFPRSPLFGRLKKERAAMHVSSIIDRPKKSKTAAPVVELAIGERLVSKRDMLARVNKSYATVISLMAKGEFPRPRTASGRPVWLDSELTEWMRNLPSRLVRGDPGALEFYAKENANAKKSAEVRRHNLAEQRRDNVRVRARKSERANPSVRVIPGRGT
jgi:predicted DNA-binding transcriptional regulator AlpA